MKTAAIILAAGSGTRLGGEIPKQYMLMCEKPVLYYSIRAYEDSLADEIILVTAAGYREYVYNTIICNNEFKKIKTIAVGGRERYDSVLCGLRETSADYVLIHDGARPLVTPELINGCIKDVKIYDASVTSVRSKDTVRIADGEDIPVQTPTRDSVWLAQTPQAFKRTLLLEAYKRWESGSCAEPMTDDAMLLEQMCGKKPHMYQGSYSNIKITTREDLIIAEALLKNLKNHNKDA